MTMINKSMLSRPRKLTFPFGWCGHIPFVSWLVEEMKPGTIVELGTHSGNSYFAICRAVWKIIPVPNAMLLIRGRGMSMLVATVKMFSEM